MSLRDILTILFMHKKLIIAVTASLFAVIAVITLAEHDVYRSEARVMLRVGRENISVDPAVMGSTLGISRTRENEINSEISIIASRNVIEKTVDTLGVDTVLGGEAPPGERDTEKRRLFAINKVSRDLHVEHEQKSNNIKMQYYSNDPQLAQLILGTVIQTYLKRHIEVYRSRATLDFFQKRVDELQTRIKKKEALLAAYQQEHNLVDPEHQQQLLTDQIMTMQKRSDDIKRELVALYARRQVLQRELKNLQPFSITSRISGMPNRTAEDLKTRLVELRIQEADLKAKYPESSKQLEELLVPLREKIAMVKDALKQENDTLTEETTAPDAAYRALHDALRNTETRLSELSAEQSALGPLLNERLEQRAEMVETERDLQEIRRNISFDREEYQQYRAGLQKARIAAALDVDQISNIAIVQPATLPIEPVAPNRKLDLALGLLISLLAGIGTALLREHFDDTLKTESDILNRLGLTMLADFSAEEYEACRR